MTTIWKFPLATTDRQTVSVPAGATALSVAEQNGGLSLWAMIDTEEKEKTRTVIRSIHQRGKIHVQQQHHIRHLFIKQVCIHGVSSSLRD